MTISASTLLRPLATLALASSLVGCALPLAPTEVGSDTWEHGRNAAPATVRVEPAADTQLARR